jgi:hypothetical protein
VLLLVGTLVMFPPLFVLGPLAGLLAASRPRSVREWAWIAAALLWIGVIAATPDGLATQAIYAWALCVTGTFVVLMLATGCSVVTGALASTVISFIMATIWFRAIDISWGQVQFAVEHAARSAWRLQAESAGPDYFGNRAEVQEAMHLMITSLRQVLPAVLVVAILPALAVAWSWYRRLAQEPLGAPAERFVDFRFSDQLIWGVVLGLVAMVAPIPPPFDAVVANLALVIGVLYLVRGVAIILGRLQSLPGFLLVLMAMAALVFLPVLLGVAFALGVADTWVDFRRRALPVDQTRE